MNHLYFNEIENKVMFHKYTEPPFTGEYHDFFDEGVYVCKNCRTPLYYSNHKFKSDCGWPSFDNQIENAVKTMPDPDGKRTEISCTTCGIHLGHIFHGEQLTDNNVRHCVNSASIVFLNKSNENANKP